MRSGLALNATAVIPRTAVALDEGDNATGFVPIADLVRHAKGRCAGNTLPDKDPEAVCGLISEAAPERRRQWLWMSGALPPDICLHGMTADLHDFRCLVADVVLATRGGFPELKR